MPSPGCGATQVKQTVTAMRLYGCGCLWRLLHLQRVRDLALQDCLSRVKQVEVVMGVRRGCDLSRRLAQGCRHG